MKKQTNKKPQGVLEASCVICGKKVYALYETELKYNMQAHEDWCAFKLTNSKDKVKANLPLQLEEIKDEEKR